ncbi:12657_t:CDS:10, partial [Acaulospora colombiana]
SRLLSSSSITIERTIEDRNEHQPQIAMYRYLELSLIIAIYLMNRIVTRSHLNAHYDSFEFDLHTLVLDQLADILSTDPDTTDEEIVRLINRCPQIPVDGDVGLGVINRICIQNITALSHFAANTRNKAFVEKILPILLNYLKLLPKFSFEDDLTWKDYSLPDRLSEVIITELLNIAIKSNQCRGTILEEVVSFIGGFSELLKCGNVIYISTIVLPMLNGMFRALHKSQILWNSDDFESLAHHLQALVSNDCIQEVDSTLESLTQSTDSSLAYARKFLSRYSFQGCPLSSGVIMYSFTTLMRNVLVRVMLFNGNIDEGVPLMPFKDLWDSLVSSKAKMVVSVTENVRKYLRKIYVVSLQYFSELTKILDKLISQGNDCPPALYAREIMSTCLDLSVVASVFLHEVDDEVISDLSSSLFIVPQTPDLKVQTSALDAATILALKLFPEDHFKYDPDNKKILDNALNDFRISCIGRQQSLNSGLRDYTISTLSYGGHERTPTSQKFPTSPGGTVNSLVPDQISIHTSISAISRSEESRQQMLENIVCTVAGVACILKDDEITALCVSMLGPRLRNHTPALDVVILEKFVDLALISSEKIFSEIVHKFSDISRQSLSPDNKVVTTAKGVVIQQTVAKNGKFQITSLVGEIGILLPVLKTLLSHKDFKAYLNASEELAWVREWRDSLIVIAQKTPPLVQESARNYLEGDLEFNSVLVRGNSDQDLSNVRTSLSAFLPNRAYEIKYFSFAEVTFLLSVYHIEIMRSQMGQFSFIQRYFVNEGVNASKLVGCMEEIGNQVIEVFIRECSSRMIAHTIDNDIRTQVRNLMIATCHRLSKVHQLAIKHLDSLMSAFPFLLCDKNLLFLLLELIELVWQSCEMEYANEYSPVYTFSSVRVGVTLYLTDSYDYRREMLTHLYENSRKWLSMAITRVPHEIRGLLEGYLTEFGHCNEGSAVHMGRSVALEVAKYFSRFDPNTVMPPRMSPITINNVSEFICDYSARRYYCGQVSGTHHLTNSDGEDFPSFKMDDGIMEEQKRNMRTTLINLERKVRKGYHIPHEDLNSILHSAAGMLVSMSKPDEDIVHYIVWIPVYLFTRESIKLGISIWNWIINEKLMLEMRVMTEVASGWIWTLRNRKGLFSSLLKWPYGGNKRLLITEYKLLIETYKLVENDKVELSEVLLTAPKKFSTVPSTFTLQDREENLGFTAKSKKLLLLFLESEINNLSTWINPLNSPEILKETFVPSVEKNLNDDGWKAIIRHSWSISPSLSVQMASRFNQTVVQSEVHRMIVNYSAEAVGESEALPLLLGDKLSSAVIPQLKYLLYWAPVPPITAVSYFLTSYSNHPLVLQYAMRSLEYHPVDVVFFYIPQIVQALRLDHLGYVERFIMSTAKISQLFAHQIIWNMNANMYKDDESLIPDSLKPALERVIENIVDSLSGKDKEFYEREFSFFNAVTSISGKLKPYIKKSKMEKKAKIDEEMAKIQVDVGVYLPSNPEGKVVGIDYKSGRPLQSHAKAPFMATFRIRKEANDSEEIKEIIQSGTVNGKGSDHEIKTVDVWQAAIFKVGDDCRQDVLALQLIAIFKNIFTSIGLDLYLFPYRVVATAPGCGVIDVIPNSISRDQLGREKVNSLYDVAAYSVVSFLLQIKDRHNGNIMLDDEGHIIHIDFGFILDIAPGGITFESSPFKLTTEMIQVMGGNADVQQFKWFSELCIKSYLASRPYAEGICQVVSLMLGSGLPCFKGETLKRLRDRFQVGKTERRAAEYMIEKINQSFENKRTVWYDSFQKATNGRNNLLISSRTLLNYWF